MRFINFLCHLLLASTIALNPLLLDWPTPLTPNPAHPYTLSHYIDVPTSTVYLKISAQVSEG